MLDILLNLSLVSTKTLAYKLVSVRIYRDASRPYPMSDNAVRSHQPCSAWTSTWHQCPKLMLNTTVSAIQCALTKLPSRTHSQYYHQLQRSSVGLLISWRKTKLQNLGTGLQLSIATSSVEGHSGLAVLAWHPQ